MALTVTDLDASVTWYESVFGVTYRMDLPHDGGVAKILFDDDRQLMIALHRHEVNNGRPFSERATGLDHAGFRAAIAWTSSTGSATSRPTGSSGPTRPIAPHAVADPGRAVRIGARVLRPDNIQLELFARPA